MKRVFLLVAIIAFSATLANAAEKQIGQPCSGDTNSADWDTIAQCNGTAFVKAPLMLGGIANPPYSSTACSSTVAGMLQWTGTSFQGCNGTSWDILGSSSSGPSYLGSTSTETSPSRSNDVTTGLFSDTATSVSISVGGVERLRVNNSNIVMAVSSTGAFQIGGANAIRLTASGNPIIGNTGMSATIAPGNLAIGYQALENHSSASGSVGETAVGYQALASNTSGVSNTAIGYQALANKVQGGGNTAIGYQALKTATLSYGSTAVGAFALMNATSSVGANTAIGDSALRYNTTGYYNTAVGSVAMENNREGYNNTAVGYGALYHSPTGIWNTAIGTDSLRLTASDYNTVVGGRALYANDSGANNVGIGYAVGRTTLQTGSYNILIGTSSAVDTVGTSTSNSINIQNSIAGTTGGTNPSICTIGQPCVLGRLSSANFNSTADQAIVIGPMTSTDPLYLKGVTKYSIQEIVVASCSASLTTAKGAFYTAASKGGTVIGTTTTAYTNCTGTTKRHRLTAITNMDTNMFTAATIYLSLTTVQGSAVTADVYIIGTPLN